MKTKLVRGLSVATLVAFAFVYAAPMLPVLVAEADGGPTISINAPVNIPGANVTVSGSGFGAGESVLVSFGVHTATVTADGSGNISGVSLPIPTVPAGLQFVSAFGETSGHWALGYVWIAGYTPAVSPNSWYILPGQTISFTGTGFAPNESIQATYNNATIGSTTTNASGSFTLGGVSLPLSLHNTTASVTFKGATSGASASATLTIGQLFPSITPSTWYTAPGSIISISGSGFAPNEAVTVVAGSSSASTTANATGSFTVGSLALPKTANTKVTITATGATSGAVGTASITLSALSPWLSFSTYWAQGGSPLTIFGNGFAGGEMVSIVSGTQSLGTTTALGNGSFSFAGAVPFAPAGPVTITATGASSGAAGSGTLTVAPVYTSFTLGSYAVKRGTALELIGSGYLPNEPVQITTGNTGSTVVLTITASASGTFDNSSYIIPANTTPGNMTVTAYGTHSFDTKTVTLYVGQ